MSRLLLALPFAWIGLCASEALPKLVFNAPAKSFHESCLIGNGRLGAMVWGNLETEHIVLNEQTLWSGSAASPLREDAYADWKKVTELLLAGKITEAEKLAENTLTAKEWGMTRGSGPRMTFGCYQTLGVLSIGDQLTSVRAATSPSGHGGEPGEGPNNLVDDDSSTKWCVVHDNRAASIEINLGSRQRFSGYALTSGNDLPGRDPREWSVEVSTDGTHWQTVQQKSGKAVFVARKQRVAFNLDQAVEASRVRFTFQPNKGTDPMEANYLQLSEIEVFPAQLKRLTDATRYERVLELGTGASVTRAGERTRTVQALREPNVIAIVEEGVVPFDLTLRLSRKQDVSYRTEGEDFIMEGQLPSNDNDQPGVRYHARLRVRAEAISREMTTEGITLKGIKGRAVFAIAARTSFAESNPAASAKADLDQALPANDNGAKLIAAVLNRETREPMGRFSLEIEGTPPEVLALSTPERVARMKKGEDDPDLIATYAQFGRHLLVGSSAPDSALPANLQGLWAEEYTPPWNADYHTNINVQMNYWPAHPANLADHAAPYHRYIFAMAKSGEAYAKQYFRARGWQGGISSNAWAVAAPGDPGSAGWTLLPAVNGWLAEDLIRHVDYTGIDLEFLSKAYPVVKGAAQFYQDTLIELPGRGLVTSPSSSPENAYRLPNGEVHKMCLGATMDLQVAMSAMTSAYRLATTLVTDKAESKSWTETVKRIAPMKIGPDGRLQEWLEPYAEPEPHHRHVSHLWGLYPGNLISLRLTPELAAAARATLEKRTDASTGWSMAWKACFWARLHDGDRAYKLLRLLVGRGDPNLLCEHPPFQIDGNFGGTAAICEMLVQTNGHEIELLPALPTAWKKGRVRGICVVGANELSFAWERQVDGTLKIYDLTVKSSYMKKVSMRVGDKVQTFDVEPGKETPINF